MVDILIPGEGEVGSFGPEGDSKKNVESYLRQRSLHESTPDELLKTATTPFELFYGLRRIFSRLESGTTPPSLSESYRPPTQLTAMIERRDDLSETGEDLEKKHFLRKYDPDTGLAVVDDPKFTIMAMRTDPIPVVIDQGSGKIRRATKQDIEARLESVTLGYDFGSEKKRAEMAKAYEKAIFEMEARAIMGEHVGVRSHLKARDDLNFLVTFQHETTAKFQPEHLKALFNAPSLDALRVETEDRIENHILGDQIEEAMFCNLIMLNCGTKQRMLDFLERPGAKFLIAKMAKEEEMRRGSPYTYDDWVKDNIGSVEEWVDDNKRYLAKEVDDQGVRHLATFQEEADINSELNKGRDKPLRGRLTRYGNIAAFGGEPGDMGKDRETEFIEKFIGGCCGSVEAAWLACTMMRITGAYASEGYDVLPNDGVARQKSLLPLGEFRFISGDDEGKFYHYLFAYKEAIRSRAIPSPRGLLKRVPDMAVNLFDWAQVKVQIGVDDRGEPVFARRSIWDAWLGTPGGKRLLDLETGKPVSDERKVTKEEPYHRLGDLDFMSLDRDFHGTHGTMQWLKGREKTGILSEMKNMGDFDLNTFFPEELLKKRKYIGIALNLITLTKGSPHLYDIEGTTDEKYLTYNNEGQLVFSHLRVPKVEALQHRFFMNMMAARIRSGYFLQNIFPKEDLLLPNPNNLGGKVIKVPVTNWIASSIEMANRRAPDDYEDILERYLDDIESFYKAMDPNKRWELYTIANQMFSDKVGRVVGE